MDATIVDSCKRLRLESTIYLLLFVEILSNYATRKESVSNISGQRRIYLYKAAYNNLAQRIDASASLIAKSVFFDLLVNLLLLKIC